MTSNESITWVGCRRCNNRRRCGVDSQLATASRRQSSNVNVDCIAHRHEHASNALPLTSALISVKLVPQPDTSQTLRDHGLVYHAVCLFTLPAFARYSSCRPTEGRLRLSIPGIPGSAPRWFTSRSVIYPWH